MAVAHELQSRGWEIDFLGTQAGIEARAVPEAGFGLIQFPWRGLRGRRWHGWLAGSLDFVRAVWRAYRSLKVTKAAVVLGMGGYVAAPVGIAAWLHGVPLVVHEQNAIPGLTNRLLGRLAQRILTGFPETAGRLGPWAESVGIPVRAGLSGLPPPRERYRERRGPLRVLVLGGSQGAHFLNMNLPTGLIAAARAGITLEVWHQSGEKEYSQVQAAYRDAPFTAWVMPFIGAIEKAYDWCDLVFCRAGATSVAELATVGIPAVLVPYPFAVDNHQEWNAAILVRRGAAVCLPQGDWGKDTVSALLLERLQNRTTLAAMGESAHSLAHPGAAQQVAEVCIGVSNGSR